MRKKQIIHHVPIIKIPTDPARHLEQVFNIFYTHGNCPRLKRCQYYWLVGLLSRNTVKGLQHCQSASSKPSQVSDPGQLWLIITCLYLQVQWRGGLLTVELIYSSLCTGISTPNMQLRTTTTTTSGNLRPLTLNNPIYSLKPPLGLAALRLGVRWWWCLSTLAALPP